MLEGGRARDNIVLLRDAEDFMRKWAVRVGVFMGDMPEINRLLGT